MTHMHTVCIFASVSDCSSLATDNNHPYKEYKYKQTISEISWDYRIENSCALVFYLSIS